MRAGRPSWASKTAERACTCSITFAAPDKRYLWYTVELNAEPPPCAELEAESSEAALERDARGQERERVDAVVAELVSVEDLLRRPPAPPRSRCGG